MIIKTLPCKCHGVRNDGVVLTKIEQYSLSGKQGIQTRIGKKWKCLRATITRSGYRQVNIHGKIIRVNRLIAFNFIKNPFGLPESQHKNGDRLDNRVSNLKWGNQKQNAVDRKKHGNNSEGVKNWNSKLNDKKVKKIRELRKIGISYGKLAKKFKVSKKLIILVVKEKIWKHVK